MDTAKKNLYTIPVGANFARALAARLLVESAGKPEDLASIRLFLPTRRACRMLREEFLNLSAGAPLVLPAMQPLGDIDEDELSLSIAGQDGAQNLLALPPGLSPLKRQMLLARTIATADGFSQSFDHALALAQALGHLMDQIYTEGLDMANLATLVPEEFADHWQITLRFLSIISEEWPKILAENGAIDAADRRNRLIRTLATHWRNHPPQSPVIAAGSTGSIPATAELLGVIAALPVGCVILPGLDQAMDEESWQTLEESHPQWGLKQLLERLEMTRDQARIWPHEAPESATARRTLSTEIMRPAAATQQWAHLATSSKTQQNLRAALDRLALYECRNEREEAEIIAILFRETLQQKGRTAALVTPDRDLARRVAMICRRWGIAIDDSAGRSLDQSFIGSFLLLILEACRQDCAPVALLALLKHPYTRAGLRAGEFHAGLEELERTALRGPKPAPGINGIKARLPASAHQADRILGVIAPNLERITAGPPLDSKRRFSDLLKSHLEIAETLAKQSDTAGSEILWAGEDGESATVFFAELADHAHLMPSLSLADYAAALNHLLQTVTVRPSYGTHPRLSILGPLEARLVAADRLILGGLNEGTWPGDPGHDPWMSRPMRKTFGLPSLERGIGLAAHDFVQGFCAGDVVLTRAARMGGAPAIPARWLQRLHSVLGAAAISHALLHGPASDWAQHLNREAGITPCARPQPRPPVDKRPHQLSVTKIETWLQDPYSIYARYILGLEKLEPLEQAPDAAMRGNLLHEILHRFVQENPQDLPENPEERLQQMAAEELTHHHDDPAVWSFWWPRFARLTDFYLAHERTWRQTAQHLKAEVKGKMDIPVDGFTFTLTAKADRIDVLAEGAAVIDYKSAGSFSKKEIKDGRRPQLPLEALILETGGFENIPPRKAETLSYWVLTGGGAAPGEITQISGNLAPVLSHTKEGLIALITAFADEATPYLSVPRAHHAPRFNDYEHLSRIREWGVAGDSDTDAEAA